MIDILLEKLGVVVLQKKYLPMNVYLIVFLLFF